MLDNPDYTAVITGPTGTLGRAESAEALRCIGVMTITGDVSRKL